MKKKIGEIYNKPIVIGDKNLMTKNEVHKDEISGGSKEYDDLNTFLYYDDRIINIDGTEMPLCGLMASTLLQLMSSYPNIYAIVKVNNTKDIFGIDFGNYLPLGVFLRGSGDLSLVYSFKAISIPKYVFSEYLTDGSGTPFEIDKLHIFDLIKLLLSDTVLEDIVEVLKTQPTITREEFFDLLK